MSVPTTERFRLEVLDLDVPLVFPEAPRWIGDHLWLSDMFGDVLVEVWSDGHARRYHLPFRPGGIGLHRSGQLLVSSLSHPQLFTFDRSTAKLTQWHDFRELRTLAERGITGMRTPHTRPDGTVGHGWFNDVTTTADGRTYVSCRSALADSGDVIVVVQESGSLAIAGEDLRGPNGMVVTPDGSSLIVAETHAKRLTEFAIDSDGTLSRRSKWSALPDAPDGIGMDPDGCIWAGLAFAGEFVRVRRGTGVITRVPFPGRWAVACAVGGPDGGTVYAVGAKTTVDDVLRLATGNAAEEPVGSIATIRPA